MPWSRWYSIKSYIKSALWVVPLIALLVGRILKFLVEIIGTWMQNQGLYNLETGFLALNAVEARSFLDRLFTLNVSFLVFTFGSLLVAIQVAGGQYTPRIIATTLLRDNVIRWIVGLFVLCGMWVNRTMMQIDDTTVPQFQIFLAALLGAASLFAFLLLIDYSAKLLRPVSLVARVGKRGIKVIEEVYPDSTKSVISIRPLEKVRNWSRLLWPLKNEHITTQPTHKLGSPDRIITHQGDSGIVLAINLQLLLAEAQRADIIIELVPQIGDFVAFDEPIFKLYGNVSAIEDRQLQTLIAFGSERTLEQDPMFAFRILVDIAAKALSPAINDPTTAVIAIDQLHRLLRMVGARNLHSEEITDNKGRLRVIFHTPNWEDFVHISFREIRLFGSGSLQIARRLRAMAENLTQTLPEQRHPALHIELTLLDRAIEQQYQFSEDLALARIPDSQGLGGATGPAY